MHDDRELLRQYSEQRSEEAFSHLVRRHLNLVYFSALRRTNGDAHLAEDVTQLVFVSLARNATSLRTHTVLAGWLYVATRNAAAKAMRTEKRRTIREQEAYAMQETSVGSHPEWDQIRPHLDAALDDLEPRDRDAVLLRFFENRPFADIGGSLRISDDAARMRVERALEKLRALLARRGITSTTSALAMALENQAAAAAPAGLVAAVNTALLASGALGGAGSAASLGTFQSMSTTIISIGVAGAISLFAVGTAIYQTNHARQVEASLVAASKASTDRIRELQARMATSEKSLAAAEQLLRESQAPRAASAPVEEIQKKQRKAPPALSFSERMKDSVYADAWRQQTLRTIDRVHGGTFATLKLNPDQLARVKDLLVARDAARSDAVDVGREAGLTNAQLTEAVTRAKQSWNDEITGVIGNSGFALLQRDEKASNWKPMIESTFATELKSAGAPLSADQVTNLSVGFADYFEATWRTDPSGWRGVQSLTNPQGVDPQTGLNPHAQALLDRYAQHLTPDQLQAVRTFFVEQTKWNQLNRR